MKELVHFKIVSDKIILLGEEGTIGKEKQFYEVFCQLRTLQAFKLEEICKVYTYKMQGAHLTGYFKLNIVKNVHE